MGSAAPELDMETIVCAVLRATPEVTTLVSADDIASKLRRDWNERLPALRVRRWGGLPTENEAARLVVYRLQVESFAPTEVAALAGARAADVAIRNLAGSPIDGGFCTHAGKDLGINNSPDKDSQAMRYVFGAVLYAHVVAA